MGEVKSSWVAKLVEAKLGSREFRSLRAVIQDALSNHFAEKSAEEIAELGEEHELPIFNALLVMQDQQRSEGIDPTFELAGDGVGSHVRSTGAFSPEILEKLQSLDSKVFESLCARVLGCAGAKAWTIGASGDGGVDFIAMELPIGAGQGAAFQPPQPLVIGQAKRYKLGKFVSENEVRDFVGGALLRCEQLKREHSGRLGLLTPTVYAFWTTADFTESAKTYALRMGVWRLGGVAMAQLCQKYGLLGV